MTATSPPTAPAEAQAAPFRIDPLVMKGLLWSGIALVAATAVGFGWLLHMLPPPSPQDSAEKTLTWVSSHQTSMLAGAALVTFFWAFWVTWCGPVIVYMRRMEHVPVLTAVAAICAGAGGAVITMIAISWTAMAFRAENAQIVQAFHDLGWFLFLYSWPGFAVFMWLLAIAIFRDSSGEQILPRWVGWYNVYAGFAMLPASFIGLMKHGPLAWDGILSFWLVVLDFFIWMVVITVVMLRRVSEDERRLRS